MDYADPFGIDHSLEHACWGIYKPYHRRPNCHLNFCECHAVYLYVHIDPTFGSAILISTMGLMIYLIIISSMALSTTLYTQIWGEEQVRPQCRLQVIYLISNIENWLYPIVWIIHNITSPINQNKKINDYITALYVSSKIHLRFAITKHIDTWKNGFFKKKIRWYKFLKCEITQKGAKICLILNGPKAYASFYGPAAL